MVLLFDAETGLPVCLMEAGGVTALKTGASTTVTAGRPILYLTESDVRQTLTTAEAVDLAEKGIVADAAGRVVGDKFYMNVGEAGFTYVHVELRERGRRHEVITFHFEKEGNINSRERRGLMLWRRRKPKAEDETK